MKLALASPPIPLSLDQGLKCLEEMVKDASLQDADLICFPESYLPGYPGMGYQEYGKAGLFVSDINPKLATGYLAQRFKKWLFL